MQDTSQPQHSTDANDTLYRELLHRRQEELDQQATALMQEERSITEVMMRKRQESGNADSAIAGNASYADNRVYKVTNSGGNPAISVRHCIHPLSPDECDIYEALTAQPGYHITAMPNHCISDHGDAMGFKFGCPAQASADAIPINREMFFRHSMVECTAKAAAQTGVEDQFILGMLMQQEQVLQKLVSLVQRLHRESEGKEASLDCIPENEDLTGQGKFAAPPGESVMGAYMAQKASDSTDWLPEAPRLLGLYHAYIKGFNQVQRSPPDSLPLPLPPVA